MKFSKVVGFMLMLVTIAMVAGVAQSQDDRVYFNARSPSDADLPPYSGAVRVGDTLYMAGTIGVGEDGKVPEDAADETRYVMNNIKRTVEAAGMTMDDIVSVQVFCSDLSHYQAFNGVYRTFFTREYPVRAFLGSGPLLLADARFEVQAIAVKR